MEVLPRIDELRPLRSGARHRKECLFMPRRCSKCIFDDFSFLAMDSLPIVAAGDPEPCTTGTEWRRATIMLPLYSDRAGRIIRVAQLNKIAFSPPKGTSYPELDRA